MKQHYPCQTWARRAFLFLLVLTLKTQAASSSMTDDTSGITLHVVNQPIENIFKLIEKQTGLTFYYGRSILDGTKTASLSVTKASLAEVMDVLLKGKNVSWRVKDKGVVLSKGEVVPERAAAGSVGDTVPRISVSGVVTDVKGNVLAGASVSLKGQPRGQGTDASGRFSFVDLPSNATLVISSVGFDTKQVKIGGKTELRITLDSMIREIQAVEVVSTGYQSLPRERVNGSYVQLDNALINRSVSTGILDRIMDVTSSLRAGRSAIELTIRGYSTINANSYPLIVVDGFPYEEAAAGLGMLNNLNPNDVESITILRDAASASIWGARSGNGVIVIATKKGNFNRRLSVQLNANMNFIEKPRLSRLRLMSSSDAIAYERAQFAKGTYDFYDDFYPAAQFFPTLSPASEIMLAQRRGELTQAQADEKLSVLSNHNVRDDISKYLLRTGVNQQYNLNVSGGTDKVSYYGSVGYDRNDMQTVGNSGDRVTLRIDNSFKPFKIVELRTFVSYTQSQSKTNGIDYLSLIADGKHIAAPYTRLADQNGSPLHIPALNGLREPYIDSLSIPGLLDWHYRPLEEMKINDNISKLYSTRLGGSLKINLLAGLDVEFKGQYETVNSNSSNYFSIQNYTARDLINSFMQVAPDGKITYPVPLGGILDYSTTQVRNWNTRIQINYNKNWDNNSINAIGGYETSESDNIINGSRLYGYNPSTEQSVPNIDYTTLFPRRPFGNSGTGSVPTGNLRRGLLTRTLSYFGNAGYMLNNKYSITVSGRIDASNFMGAKANQRHTPLWSTGLGWDISKESFYNIPRIPYLKLRGTYGYNGNLNNKASALPIATYSAPNLIDGYHQEPYLTLQSPPNPGLTWEKIRMINFGADFQIKGDRISGSIEYYTKRGINLIGVQRIEATRGISQYVTNYASIKGNGFDLMLKSFPIKRNVLWQNEISLSYNTDKVTDYADNGQQQGITIRAGDPGTPVVGKPLWKFFSYPSAGLASENGAPRAYLKGEIIDFNNFLTNATSEDLTYHGSAVPQLFGNMINTLTYKGVTFSFNITFKFQYYFRRESVNYNSILFNWGAHGDYAQRWQKPGDETHTTVPSLPDVADTRSEFYKLSSDLIERGDHIRLQDLRLSYNIGSMSMLRLKISAANIFAYAGNLGILWRANKSGLDPMYFDNTLPPSRTIAIGFNISL